MRAVGSERPSWSRNSPCLKELLIRSLQDAERLPGPLMLETFSLADNSSSSRSCVLRDVLLTLYAMLFGFTWHFLRAARFCTAATLHRLALPCAYCTEHQALRAIL